MYQIKEWKKSPTCQVHLRMTSFFLEKQFQGFQIQESQRWINMRIRKRAKSLKLINLKRILSQRKKFQSRPLYP